MISEFNPISDRPYFLPGYKPGEHYEMFDGFGNSLCCLHGLGTKDARAKCLAYAKKVSKFNLVPAFYPPISKDDIRYQYLVSAGGGEKIRNGPGQYHNGGLWPMVTGFWALSARLQGDESAATLFLSGISDANRQNNYSYPEFISANTGKPGGTLGQAWSAAAMIIGNADKSLIPEEYPI